MEALDRVRSNPKLSVAIACGVLLVLAWIGWAIYVTNGHGLRAGLGVLLAWPALVAAATLVVLLLYGGYLLIRRLLPDESGASVAPAAGENPGNEAGNPGNEESGDEDASRDEEPEDEEEPEDSDDEQPEESAAG